MPYTDKQRKLIKAAAHDKAVAKHSGMNQKDARRMEKEMRTMKPRHMRKARTVLSPGD